jgi:FixJ family two-component response regulator
VNAFSAVAQRPEPRVAACDLGALVEGVAKLYRGSSPVEFRVEVASPLPLAWADEAQIQRVLVNLIKNAMEASPGKGAVTLRVLRDSPAEPVLRVEVEDTGPGMDPATLERAMAPGFTTKSTGSGLGLTLVQRIVEQHPARRSGGGVSQSPRTRVLVVDDEPSVLLEISGALKRHYDVVTAQSAEEAESILAKDRVDLLLTDLRLPGKDGIHLLEVVKAQNPDLPVVIMSGHGTIEEAVRATRMGAADFVEKPFGPDRLSVTVERALELRELRRENESLRSQAVRLDEMVGQSHAMEQVRAEIAKVARSEAKVLITGESGAGKELVARAIHRASARSRGPFEKLNCAALPKDLVESELFGYEKGAFTGAAQMKRGRLEAADRGTLFLDEVGDMSLETQAKFLRAIETGEIERLGGTRTLQVDTRIVAATNKNLSEEIQASRFR